MALMGFFRPSFEACGPHSTRGRKACVCVHLTSFGPRATPHFGRRLRGIHPIGYGFGPQNSGWLEIERWLHAGATNLPTLFWEMLFGCVRCVCHHYACHGQGTQGKHSLVNAKGI